MTMVMLLDDVPGLGVMRGVAAERAPSGFSPLSDEGLEFTERIARGLREHSAVLALYPAWRPEAAGRLLRFARASLRTGRLAIVPLDLPPLALSLVADQLAFMAPYVRPGALASLAPRLAEVIVAGAWVNSVTRLEQVRTGFGEHLASFVPGSEFMVTATPRAGVHRITEARPVPSGDRVPAAPALVLAAEHGGDAGWVRDRLGPALGAVSVTFVDDPPLGTEFWRARRYVEFVGFSGDSGVLQQLVRTTPCAPCTWCGEPVGLPECPFCSMIQPVRTTPAGSAPPPAARRTRPARPGRPAPVAPVRQAEQAGVRMDPPPERLVPAPP
ncbi:hypothetical protein [Actinomadura rubrisoli]|uniref:Uncharacterized protein n=1 Tax=Actinomadura rubrisoli TaxID=2530368 RepID=A0A4R4ZSR9_9ACTN|nr:hypothetical protein [Actinomadura rubrisoli]TDD62111.1 hypothetical protein E1298_44890 [Actinomadura rubrisoli]